MTEYKTGDLAFGSGHSLLLQYFPKLQWRWPRLALVPYFWLHQFAIVDRNSLAALDAAHVNGG